MRVDLAVNVRKEEQLLVSLDHETGEMHGTEVILHFREIGHQRGQLFGERLGVGGPPNREVNGEMILNVTALCFAHRGFSFGGQNGQGERLCEPAALASPEPVVT